MILKHIPNCLTLIRLLLIAPFLGALYYQAYPYALTIFIVAGLTDALDGWLARTYHWQSELGSMIDPVADKLLIAASFLSLAIKGTLPWWLVILVFMRDLTISGGAIAWYWFVRRPFLFQPTFLSKINTVLQLTLVTACLFEQAFSKLSPYWIETLMALTAVTTASSYLDYVWTWGKKACLSTRPAK